MEFNNLHDSYASPELREELEEKLKSSSSKSIVNFAYTDYGGSTIDKFAIEYFEENFPDDIIWERTGWNGKNAFIWGEVADEWIEEYENYPLGFRNFASFFSEKEMEEFTETEEEIIKEYHIPKKYWNQFYDWFESHAQVITSGVDYSEHDVEDFLRDELGMDLEGDEE